MESRDNKPTHEVNDDTIYGVVKRRKFYVGINPAECAKILFDNFGTFTRGDIPNNSRSSKSLALGSCLDFKGEVGLP